MGGEEEEAEDSIYACPRVPTKVGSPVRSRVWWHWNCWGFALKAEAAGRLVCSGHREAAWGATVEVWSARERQL